MKPHGRRLDCLSGDRRVESAVVERVDVFEWPRRVVRPGICGVLGDDAGAALGGDAQLHSHDIDAVAGTSKLPSSTVRAITSSCFRAGPRSTRLRPPAMRCPLVPNDRSETATTDDWPRRDAGRTIGSPGRPTDGCAGSPRPRSTTGRRAVRSRRLWSGPGATSGRRSAAGRCPSTAPATTR
jgi:hypothetical protein